MESLTSGTLAGTGSFRCEECGYVVTLAAADALPDVPELRRRELRPRVAVRRRRASPAGPTSRPPEERRGLDRHGPRASSPSPASTSSSTRRRRPASSPLEREWTRVGRSLAADVRFDDPTVSRRHALIVRQADGVRVLDDRSLNGVFVNGERVEWRDAARRRRDRRRPLPPALPRRRDGRRPARRDRRAPRPRAARRRGRTGPADASRAGGATLGAPWRDTIAVLSQKGGTGKTTTVRHAHRRLPPRRACACSPSTSIRRATCRTTSTSIPRPTPTIGDVLDRPREGRRGRPRRRHPGEPLARRGRAGARRARWAAS